MTTRKQSAANRRNAQKSTGPTSKEGKIKVSLNSLKHGALSEATPSPTENIDGYYDYLAQLREQYCPQNVRENQLVERIALLLWREVRLARYEVELISMGHSAKPILAERVHGLADAKRNAFKNGLPPIEEQLCIARYQTMLSNQLRQAFADLEEMVTSRDQGQQDDDVEDAEWQEVIDDNPDAG